MSPIYIIQTCYQILNSFEQELKESAAAIPKPWKLCGIGSPTAKQVNKRRRQQSPLPNSACFYIDKELLQCSNYRDVAQSKGKQLCVAQWGIWLNRNWDVTCKKTWRFSSSSNLNLSTSRTFCAAVGDTLNVKMNVNKTKDGGDLLLHQWPHNPRFTVGDCWVQIPMNHPQ